jgi:hypothetical protein
MITINGNQVYIDGRQTGSIEDVKANYPGLLDEIGTLETLAVEAATPVLEANQVEPAIEIQGEADLHFAE